MTLRELVKRRLDSLAQPYKDNLIGGAAADLAEYKRMAGFVEGVTKAYTEIEGILNEDGDDDIGR